MKSSTSTDVVVCRRCSALTEAMCAPFTLDLILRSDSVRRRDSRFARGVLLARRSECFEIFGRSRYIRDLRSSSSSRRRAHFSCFFFSSSSMRAVKDWIAAPLSETSERGDFGPSFCFRIGCFRPGRSSQPCVSSARFRASSRFAASFFCFSRMWFCCRWRKSSVGLRSE